MPIDSTHNSSTRIHSGPSTRQSSSDVTRTERGQRSANTPSVRGGDVNHLRGVNTADASQDINSARVAEIRQGIANGTLVFHADRIADGILTTAREMAGDDAG